MRATALSVVFALTLFCTNQATAQSMLEQVAQKTGAACPQLVGRILAVPGFTAATSARPVTQRAVCSCAETRIALDPRLKEALAGEQQLVMTRVQDVGFKNYLGVRMAEVTLACLAIELDASASAIPLPQ